MDELIKRYFRLGYTHLEIVATLEVKHNSSISIRQLQRALSRLGLYRHKNQTDLDHVRRIISTELQTSGQLHGYRWMHLKLIQRGVVISKENVRRILLELDPEGVLLRKRRRLARRRYCGRGPNFIWHLDCMDKLKSFGIGISGCIDGFSRKIIWLEANSNTSDPQHIGGFYLEAVQKIGGSPIVVRADRGTENGHVGCFQKFLREHDDILSGDKSFMVGRSTANQRIEAWWGQLRKQCTEFWLTLFHFLAEEGHFCGDLLDKELIRFIFLKFVQNDLDEVVRTWDGHLIRKSKQDHVTCGRPDTMFFLPEVYQTQDFLKRVDQEKIEICREDCKFKSDCPCDPDFFDFCCRTMATNAWEYPDCPEDAMTLFVNLRRHVRNALNI